MRIRYVWLETGNLVGKMPSSGYSNSGVLLGPQYSIYRNSSLEVGNMFRRLAFECYFFVESKAKRSFRLWKNDLCTISLIKALEKFDYLSSFTLIKVAQKKSLYCWSHATIQIILLLLNPFIREYRSFIPVIMSVKFEISSLDIKSTIQT